MSEETQTHYIKQGETHMITCPYSEVCMHMRVAGKPMGVQLVGEEYPMAQLYRDDGTKFSFPILPSEAGILRDGSQYYIMRPYYIGLKEEAKPCQ